MSDDREPVTITFVPAHRELPCRVRFEPRPTGPAWTRVEQVQTGDGEWRTIGTERVDELDVEGKKP